MPSNRSRLPIVRSLQRGLGWLVFASGSLVALTMLMQIQRLAH